MAQFRINYDKVISQADSMENLADDLQRRINELSNMQALARKEWVGPASTAFQKKLSALIDEMRGTQSDISSVASRIKKTARSIQQEDERLAREAEAEL